MKAAAGLDIGSSKCVVAVSTAGVTDAVLNQDSKRETPTVVHFADNHRLFGTEAASYVTTKPESTISLLKRLVGLRSEWETDQKERLLLPYETVKSEDERVSVKVHYLNEDRIFTAVEMLAMLFAQLKRTSQHTKDSPMSNCVIGVPSYFRDEQKDAYWHAALIAGWNPLGLLHEGVATALAYASHRSNDDAHSVVAFVDIGLCDTQITVARFRDKDVEILGEAVCYDAGGRDFDEVIFQHFVGVFENQYGIDIQSNVKACVRLRTACEEVKRVLSANSEADVSIDYLMPEGIEYASGVITRDKFEELSECVLRKIGIVFSKVLEKYHVDANCRIDSVELVGSGSRIPAISRILTRLFERDLSRTLNGSECVACGCALLCEMLMTSPEDPSTKENISRLGRRVALCTFRKIDINYLSKSTSQEKELQNQDRSHERAKDEMNDLKPHATEVRKELKEIEEWLYGEGDDESQDVYGNKLEHSRLLIRSLQVQDPVDVPSQQTPVHSRKILTSDLIRGESSWMKSLKTEDMHSEFGTVEESNSKPNRRRASPTYSKPAYPIKMTSNEKESIKDSCLEKSSVSTSLVKLSEEEEQKLLPQNLEPSLLANLDVKRGDHDDLLRKLNTIEVSLCEEGSDASVDDYEGHILKVERMSKSNSLLSKEGIQDQNMKVQINDEMINEGVSTRNSQRPLLTIGMNPAVGLDIGNSKCVVAISSNGIVDTVQNEEPRCETPAVVHFADNHRLFGTAAASCTTAYPMSTISQMKRLVGRRFNGKNFQTDRLVLPYETSEDAGCGISVKVSSREFKAVEMLAMLVSHLKRTAELTTAATMLDCVIGVPAYFTSQQKYAYWDAALIAGWNPLGLLHEGVATALEYAADRSDDNARSVITFVDIGHCDTQVTVVRFQGKDMKVLGEAWDANLGGRDFDEVIFQHLMGVFKRQYGREIRSDVKASVRLRAACEKAKRALSENKEASVSGDYLMDGVECASGVITRDQFEELSSGLLYRIGEVFREALAKAKVVANEINSVELVGSGSRIPSISRILTGMFGRGLSRTLNGSECIAHGCARLTEKLMISSPASNFLIGSSAVERIAVEDIDTLRHERKTKLGIHNDVFTFRNKYPANLSSLKRREAVLLKQDKSYKEAKHRRNDLESRIYQLRKEVEEHRTISAKSKNTISRMLEEMELWLYKNGDGLSQDDYAAQMDALESASLLSDVFETKVSEEMSNLKLESAIYDSIHVAGPSSSAREVHRQGSIKKARRQPNKPNEGHNGMKSKMKKILRLPQKNKK